MAAVRVHAWMHAHVEILLLPCALAAKYGMEK